MKKKSSRKAFSSYQCCIDVVWVTRGSFTAPLVCSGDPSDTRTVCSGDPSSPGSAAANHICRGRKCLAELFCRCLVVCSPALCSRVGDAASPQRPVPCGAAVSAGSTRNAPRSGRDAAQRGADGDTGWDRGCPAAQLLREANPAQERRKPFQRNKACERSQALDNFVEAITTEKEKARRSVVI